MKRVRISQKMRVEIFTRHEGICHICHLKVHPGEEWDVSHEIPLEAGGADDESNWLVAHRKCHRIHTATVDAPRIAKTKRMRAKHIGIKTVRSPLPGGRGSKFKKKLDGTVVRRDSDG